MARKLSKLDLVGQWDIVISGFTESIDFPSGSELLYRRLRANSKSTHAVELREWDSDWHNFARFIVRCSVKAPRIRVYAYSWGCGHGMVRLAEELQGLGLRIHHVVSCDGVFRSRLLPAWVPFNIATVLRLGKIRVPANVDAVTWFYQRQSRWPMVRGAQIVAKDSRVTSISEGVELFVGHTKMDDQPEYHAAAISVAECAPEPVKTDRPHHPISNDEE